MMSAQSSTVGGSAKGTFPLVRRSLCADAIRTLWVAVIVMWVCWVGGLDLAAATKTWDGGGANANWSTQNNWNANTLPDYSTPLPVDDIVFGTGFGSGVNTSLNGNRVVNSLTINTTTSFSIANNTLTINTGAITDSAGGGTHTISSRVTPSANAVWNVSTGSTLVVSGVVAGGALTLTKTGGGTLTLSGGAANTITGAFSVNDGLVQFSKTAGFNAVGSTTINVGDSSGAASSAELRLTANNQIPNTANVTVNSDGLFNLVTPTTETISTLTVTGGTATIAGTAALTLGSTMAMTGGTIGGTGTLTLGGNVTINASAGGSTISVGTLALGGANRIFTVADGAAAVDLLVSSQITGAVQLTKAGTGTMVLTGANSYSGITAVSAGVLNIQNSSALGSTANGVTIANGAELQLENNITIAAAEAVTSVRGSGTGTSGAIRNMADNNTFNGQITLVGGAATFGSDAGTLTLGGQIVNAGFATTFTGAGNITASGVITGSGNLIKNGGGILTLGGASANTQNGTFTVNDGAVYLSKTGGVAGTSSTTVTVGDSTGAAGSAELRLTTSDQLLNTANVTVNSDGLFNLVTPNTDTINTLTVVGGTVTVAGTAALTLGSTLAMTGGTIDGTGTLTMGGNATISASASGSTISVGTLAIGGGLSRTFTVADGAAASDLTISSKVSGGAFFFIKAGAGTLTLSGPNDYTGVTMVNAGALNIQHNTALGTTAGGVIIANTAELQLQNNITVSSPENVISVTGVGSGSGAIRNISGANTYAGTIAMGGATTIGSDAGTLTLSGAVTTGGNALTFTGAGTTTVSSAITGGGGLTKTGAGTLNLNNNGNALGTTVSVTGGSLAMGAAGALGSGTALSIAPSTSVQANFTGTSSLGSLSMTGGSLERVVVSASDTMFSTTGGFTASGTPVISSAGGGGGALRLNTDITVSSGTLTLSPALGAIVSLSGTTTKTATISAGATLEGSGAGTLVVGPNRVLRGLGSGSGSEATVSVTTASGITVSGSPTRLDVTHGGDDNYGLRIAGKKSNVDILTAVGTLQATSASSTGTITIAYDDAGLTTRVFGSSANPLAGTAAKLGFDNAGVGTPRYTLGSGGDDQLSNWGGLVVKGGTVVVAYNNKFTGLSPGTRTTLDVLGGTLSLDSVTDSKQLWVTGDINLQAGTLAAGSGGGGGGWIKGEKDIIVTSGFNFTSAPKVESAPASGDEVRIRGTGNMSGANQLGTFTKTGAGDTRLEIQLDATTAIDLQGSGSLILNSSDLIGNSTPIKMAGARIKTEGRDDVVGTLTLSNDSYIDFGGSGTYGSDNSVLQFADSSGSSWGSSKLYLLNWTGKDTVGTPSLGTLDELYFGSSSSGLTAGQVDQIFFVNPWIQTWGSNYVGNLPAIILPTGEIVPKIVPETRTVVLTTLLGAVGLYRERRRVRTLLGLLVDRMRRRQA